LADNTSALPVELLAFDAVLSGEHRVTLDWTTASELNNSHFEIERSFTGYDFTVIGIVKGAGTTQEIKSYTFFDTVSNEKNTYYYRLRQVDYDGVYTYSPVHKVELARGSHLAIYPNPFTAFISIKLPDHLQKTNLYIYDSKGMVVLQREVENTDFVDLIDLSPGVYYINLPDMNKNLKVIKTQ
jgi:hypothetical protein